MSNLKAASLHVLAEDRRICIWEVNPVMKGNIKFWKDFSKELKDLDVIYAIYMYLKNMDVKDFNYKELHPKLEMYKQTVVQDQKQNSHAFITFLYARHDWYEFGNEHRDPRWIETQKFYLSYKGKKGRYMVRVSQDTLYKQYKYYIKHKCSGQSKFRKSTSFFEEIADIGITVHKKPARLGSKMRLFADIEYSKVNTEWKRIYKVDCPAFSFNRSKYAHRVHRYLNKPDANMEYDTESEVESESEEKN
jgi:hypothetical protein